MLFHTLLIDRIIVVSIAQTWPIIYLSIFAYKLLQRSKNRSTITLSSFFIMLAVAYLISLFSLFSVYTPFSLIFYLTSWYLIMLSHYLLVVFSALLLKIEKKISIFRFHIILALCASIVTVFFCIGISNGGIRYDSSTGWRPVFSLFFALFNWIYFFFLLVIPQIIMSFKLVKIYEGSRLIIRIKLYLLSTFLEFMVNILMILYNTLPDGHMYRSVHLFIGPPISMIGAYLIYRSFGKKID